MKKLLLLLTLFSLIILTACSEDDDTNNESEVLEITEDNLVGTWTYIEGTLNGEQNELVDLFAIPEMTLNEDLTISSGTMNGTWSLGGNDGNVLTYELVGIIIEDDGNSSTTFTETNSGEFNIDELQNNSMILTNSSEIGNVALTYRR